LYVDEALFGQAEFDFLMKTNGLIRISDGKFVYLRGKTEGFPARGAVTEQFCWFQGI
jgi:hypothetical protein